MFVNPIACVLVLARDLPARSPASGAARGSRNFDLVGAVLATGGMLLLVYALVKAPDVGWGTARTIGELAGALALLAAFVVNELRHATRSLRCRSSASTASGSPTSPS